MAHALARHDAHVTYARPEAMRASPERIMRASEVPVGNCGSQKRLNRIAEQTCSPESVAIAS
jgi:hypothetical protein